MRPYPTTPYDTAAYYIDIHHNDYGKAYAECLDNTRRNAGTPIGAMGGKACAIIQKLAIKAGVVV